MKDMNLNFKVQIFDITNYCIQILKEFYFSIHNTNTNMRKYILRIRFQFKLC
jgi:hypothetical protein